MVEGGGSKGSPTDPSHPLWGDMIGPGDPDGGTDLVRQEIKRLTQEAKTFLSYGLILRRQFLKRDEADGKGDKLPPGLIEVELKPPEGFLLISHKTDLSKSLSKISIEASR